MTGFNAIQGPAIQLIQKLSKPLGRCVTPGALQRTELWLSSVERLQMARLMLKYGGRDYSSLAEL